MNNQELQEENIRLKNENRELKKQLGNNSRKYFPVLGELLDRLSITQIKEVKIPEHKDKYAQEIKEIIHDIQLILTNEEIWFNAEMLRALIVLAQMNLHIWVNEANFRKGIKEGNNLELSHGLNSIRNDAKNRIQKVLGGRMDYKLDVVEACSDFIPSWND